VPLVVPYDPEWALRFEVESAMLERDSGVELSRQPLDGWVMRVGELLAPLAEALRHADPPVISRIEDGRVLLDLRAILPEQDTLLARAVRGAQ